MKGHESPQQQAYTVAEFCQAHGISKAMFYLLLGRGNAPASMMLGRRRLISREAAQRWRSRMERAAAKKAA